MYIDPNTRKDMHATIQKPIEEIVDHINPDEKVFVVGCYNCAWKC